jgi:phage-related protein
MAALPSITPSTVSVKTTKTRVLKNEYGDGYSQRAANGINNVYQEWTLVWQGHKKEDIDTLESFFEGLKGYQSFTWTPYRGSTAKKFLCDTWDRRFVGAENDTLTVKIMEVFDLSS